MALKRCKDKTQESALSRIISCFVSSLTEVQMYSKPSVSKKLGTKQEKKTEPQRTCPELAAEVHILETATSFIESRQKVGATPQQGA